MKNIHKSIIWQLTLSVILMSLNIFCVQKVFSVEPEKNISLSEYFVEPENQPYEEDILQQKQELGWHWTEFRYTSIVYQGEPIRVHAVYAVPDDAKVDKKVPAILMTHGIFGSALSKDTRYWNAISSYVKAGYAVLFFDWYPNFARDWKPEKPDEPKNFTTFGKLDYFTKDSYLLTGNDMKDSLHYQVIMAARRAITWLYAKPEIDTNNIGVTGASYGGIFSSMIAGIDHRITAANPIVYTAGFGIDAGSYNNLPKTWTPEQITLWKSRFDSEILLQKRKIPILYTIGSNDNVFFATKAMRGYELMNEPKSLMIGPNEGHGYWAIDQSVLFFDFALKNKIKRPRVEDIKLEQQGREVIATVKTIAQGEKVDIFYTFLYEKDPDLGFTSVPTQTWNWSSINATPIVERNFKANISLPVMRPFNPKETIYRWGEKETLDPVIDDTPVQGIEKMKGAIRAFARVTDKNGVITCSSISAPLLFSDSDTIDKKPIQHTMPKFESGTIVKSNSIIDINTNAAIGQPMATFALPLPVKSVGTGGYILWNWNKEQPSNELKTKDLATPTKKILTPFTDTIKTNSFQGGKQTAAYGSGGMINFTINGTPAPLSRGGTAWHGSVPLGQMGAEEITIVANDTNEHRLTLVMGSPVLGAANVRVSLSATDGAMETVQYYQIVGVDHVLQFRFTGTAILKVQLTSIVAHHPAASFTHIGPTALFFD
jgi:cephalosporin-C deacetylase-like acetyl esterase